MPSFLPILVVLTAPLTPPLPKTGRKMRGPTVWFPVLAAPEIPPPIPLPRRSGWVPVLPWLTAGRGVVQDVRRLREP